MSTPSRVMSTGYDSIGLDLARRVERRNLRHRLLDVRRQLLGLLLRARVVPRLEVRHARGRANSSSDEQMSSWRLLPPCWMKIDLVDADLLERLEVGAHLVGVADAARRHRAGTAAPS